MLQVLFLLIVVFSVIEIAIFVWLGNVTSIWFVLIGIILTGVIGAFLAKWQGISTLNRARQEMAQRRMPKDEIFDGIAILIGAVLLFTPGFLTDLLGFLLLIPVTRKPFKVWAQAQLLSMIKKGSVKRFHIYRR